jgi:hypothetical protein
VNPRMRSSLTRRVLGLTGLLATLALAGCGSDSTIVDPGSPGPGPAPTPVASITLIAGSNILPSDGGTPVELSVLVRDANNNLVTNVPVRYAADSGVLQVIPVSDDGTGLPRALLSTGGDPTNRPIVVTATTGTLTDSLTINVTGTNLTINGPGVAVQGDLVNFTARLADSANRGLAGRTVNIASSAGNLLSASSLLTDPQGEISFQVTATVAGADTISVSALGLAAQQAFTVSAEDTLLFLEPVTNAEIPLNTSRPVTVEWRVDGVPQAGATVNFSTTRGTLSALSATLNAQGQATVNISAVTAGPATLSAQVGTTGPQTQRQVEFVALTPHTIVVQASRFTVAPGEQSTIIATVRDISGNPVKNKIIQFQLEDITGGSLSAGTAVTGSAGTAQTVYTGGPTISGSGDVTVRAIVQENPALMAAVGLTVARRQVDISIGTGNELFEPDTASYEREFIVQVTDSQGVGVADAVVQLSARSKYYRKGFYVPGPNDRWVAVSDAFTFAPPLRCADEDLNLNGQLDADEDFNNSGWIEAGNVVSVSPGEVTTNASGVAIFRIRYAQEFGNWVLITLKARAAVQGTEFEDSSDHQLEITAADANINQSPPGGIVSRFGGDDLDPTPDPTDEGLINNAARLAELGFPGGRPLGCRTLN